MIYSYTRRKNQLEKQKREEEIFKKKLLIAIITIASIISAYSIITL